MPSASGGISNGGNHLFALRCNEFGLRGAPVARLWDSRARLLFWSGLCFVGLTLNNVLLFIDLRVLPERDLFLLRSMPTLVGLLLLIYGLIWDTD
jgi:hypothetical protein